MKITQQILRVYILFGFLALLIMVSCEKSGFSLAQRFKEANKTAKKNNLYALKLKEVLEKCDLNDFKEKQCILYYSLFENEKGRIYICWLTDNYIPVAFELRNEKAKVLKTYRFNKITNELIKDSKDFTIDFHATYIWEKEDIPHYFSIDKCQVRLLDHNDKAISGWVDVQVMMTDSEYLQYMKNLGVDGRLTDGVILPPLTTGTDGVIKEERGRSVPFTCNILIVNIISLINP